jgi:hypothetical protein
MMKHDPQKENPDSVSAEIGVQGIEALPSKVSRYSKAKKGALDVADFMATIPKHQAMAAKVSSCGDYLAFRHYPSIDLVRLHGASLCKKHLLCPLCAIRRGAKSLKAYLDRFEVIKAQNPHLKPYLITLTVKDGPDLEERFKHLFDSQHELWKRRSRKYETFLDSVSGAVWSYEIKRGSGSGQWHPHLHMIALAEHLPTEGNGNLGALSAEWKEITGDSHMVDIRPIDLDDPVSGFIEVFKYAVKFSDQSPADTVHAWETLAGKHLLGSAGCFRGVKVPESLLDAPEGFEGLEYIQLFYRYLPGGYSLVKRSEGVEPSKKLATLQTRPPKVQTEKQIFLDVQHDRLMGHALGMRNLPGGYGVHPMEAKRN